MVKNLPARAGDTGAVPGLGRFCLQLSPRAASVEPVLLSQEPRLLSPCAAELSSVARSHGNAKPPFTTARKKNICSNENPEQPNNWVSK